jgi:hypothetical protein
LAFGEAHEFYPCAVGVGEENDLHGVGVILPTSRTVDDRAAETFELTRGSIDVVDDE